MPPSVRNLPVVRFRCDQRFDDFAATDAPGVGFCAQCRKNVHDFRGRSAAHIRAVHRAEIAAGRGTPCGAYDRQFVETPLLPEPGPWRVRWTGWLAALGAPLGLAGCATERNATEPISFASTVEALPAAQRCGTEHVRVTAVSDSANAVQGIVLDEHGEPLIGANVVILGLQQYGAISNVDGHFRILRGPIAEEAVTLRIAYIGYKTLDVRVKWGHALRLVLHEESIELSGEVIIADDGIEEGMESRGGVTTVLHRGLETIRRVVYPHR